MLHVILAEISLSSVSHSMVNHFEQTISISASLMNVLRRAASHCLFRYSSCRAVWNPGLGWGVHAVDLAWHGDRYHHVE